MKGTNILIKRIGDHELPVPIYEVEGAAGMDLRACLETKFILNPGEQRLFQSGFAISLPPEYEGQIRPRSGLAHKHGITVLNSPGTIDNGYNGQIGIILINHSHKQFTVEHGDRIAQLVINKVEHANFEEVLEFPNKSERGSGGFGSTGKK